jgi:hypothetical protein
MSDQGKLPQCPKCQWNSRDWRECGECSAWMLNRDKARCAECGWNGPRVQPPPNGTIDPHAKKEVITGIGILLFIVLVGYVLSLVK